MFDFASRIAKLDAVSLDEAFVSFLKREVTGILTTFANEENLHRFSPEITLVVKFIIWKFTTLSSGSTIGQKLLGIKYAQVPGKLKFLFILEGLLPYVIERLHSLHNSPTLQQIRIPLKYVEGTCKILNVINFCLFLVQNRYPTLATRMLALPIVSINRRLGTPAGYSFQIRELLWHQFADFLITILPLINFHKLKRTVIQLVLGSQPSQLALKSPEDITSRSTTEEGNSSGSSPHCCSVCKEDAVLPHRSGNEYFCYFCYQGLVDDGF